jgi:hypothetical protein
MTGWVGRFRFAGMPITTRDILCQSVEIDLIYFERILAIDYGNWSWASQLAQQAWSLLSSIARRVT